MEKAGPSPLAKRHTMRILEVTQGAPMARDLAPAEAKEVPSSGPLEIPIESILPGDNVREHAAS